MREDIIGFFRKGIFLFKANVFKTKKEEIKKNQTKNQKKNREKNQKIALIILPLLLRGNQKASIMICLQNYLTF